MIVDAVVNNPDYHFRVLAGGGATVKEHSQTGWLINLTFTALNRLLTTS